MSAHKTVYGARTIKRERRTKAQVAQLDKQIVDVLREDNPQSVRHVFYRMTDPRLPEPVEKSERGYRAVQGRLKELRLSGQVRYDWITDATRRGYLVNTFQDEADFLRRMKGLYRADVWRPSEFYCEVWTESRSTAGIIEDECEELAVNLYPAGGFTSMSLAYDDAKHINRNHNGRTVVIFYIGDYDPAGVLIDLAIERELRKHLDEDVHLMFMRIGISPEQIKEYDLPTKPRKATDKRSLHITETVEAEAMPAHIMRDMLRSSIEVLLPPKALMVAQAEEQSAREYFERLAEITAGAS